MSSSMYDTDLFGEPIENESVKQADNLSEDYSDNSSAEKAYDFTTEATEANEADEDAEVTEAIEVNESNEVTESTADFAKNSYEYYANQQIAIDTEKLTAGLNAQQLQAVKYEGSALLIGAGAGSGKTRVLTRRIAWILSQHHEWPSHILAITFTNKAAAEMRERLATLIGNEALHMWVSTFHSACVRILRKDGEQIGLKSGFSIYDSSDSERLIKIIATELNIDIKRFTPKSISAKISDFKNSLITWQDQLAAYAPDYRPGVSGQQLARAWQSEAVYATVYAEYQHRLAMANAVDFDDLIMRTVELMRKVPQVAQKYRRKFRYIFVDEYQDTNHAQYVLIRELSGVDAQNIDAKNTSSINTVAQNTQNDLSNSQNAQDASSNYDLLKPASITVVGDSDQSIYAFRGADIRNIQDFEKDFPHATTIMLEQNYRSTQTILDAANSVISHNQARKPKKLWTALGQGEPIIGYAANNASQEGWWIAQEISKLSSEENIPYSNIAIMYRANAQSRALEDALMRAGLPYQLVGGTKFYERKEVKDVLAYMQSIVNPNDDINIRRILNVPKRGLGSRAESLLISYAQANNTSFWNAIEQCENIPGMPTRSITQIKSFHTLMQELIEMTQKLDSKPSLIVKNVLSKTGILDELKRSEDPQDANRVENLSQLQSVAAEYEQTADEVTLAGFLEQTALVADSDQLPGSNEDTGKVTLMTLHTAKGLEYPVVFLTGMEQGTFPHSRAIDNESELCEERRLAYVGITRAKQRLYLTYAAVRSQWGEAMDMVPSQFLDEIPEDLIHWERKEAGFDEWEGEYEGESVSFGGSKFGSSKFGSSKFGSSKFGRKKFGKSRFSTDDFDEDCDDFGSDGGWDDDYSESSSFTGRAYGSDSYAKGARKSRKSSYSSYSSYGSSNSYGSSSTYGSRSSSYSSASSRTSKSLSSKSSSSFSSLSSSYAKSSSSSSSLNRDNQLNIQDFKAGDKITHDQYGLGTIISTQDKGRNSIITVDFGSDGVKRLMLRVAPIEKL